MLDARLPCGFAAQLGAFGQAGQKAVAEFAEPAEKVDRGVRQFVARGGMFAIACEDFEDLGHGHVLMAKHVAVSGGAAFHDGEDSIRKVGDVDEVEPGVATDAIAAFKIVADNATGGSGGVVAGTHGTGGAGHDPFQGVAAGTGKASLGLEFAEFVAGEGRQGHFDGRRAGALLMEESSGADVENAADTGPARLVGQDFGAPGIGVEEFGAGRGAEAVAAGDVVNPRTSLDGAAGGDGIGECSQDAVHTVAEQVPGLGFIADQ